MKPYATGPCWTFVDSCRSARKRWSTAGLWTYSSGARDFVPITIEALPDGTTSALRATTAMATPSTPYSTQASRVSATGVGQKSLAAVPAVGAFTSLWQSHRVWFMS